MSIRVNVYYKSAFRMKDETLPPALSSYKNTMKKIGELRISWQPPCPIGNKIADHSDKIPNDFRPAGYHGTRLHATSPQGKTVREQIESGFLDRSDKRVYVTNNLEVAHSFSIRSNILPEKQQEELVLLELMIPDDDGMLSSDESFGHLYINPGAPEIAIKRAYQFSTDFLEWNRDPSKRFAFSEKCEQIARAIIDITKEEFKKAFPNGMRQRYLEIIEEEKNK